jgi:hypothetical protein
VKAQVGLKGGLNLASINTDDPAASYEATTGYHLGAYALIKVLSFGIQPEVLYSVKGAAGERIDISGVKSDFSQDLVYLEFPIMAKFYLPLGLNVQAGPQFGTLISAEGKIENSGGTTTISKDSYKNSDISAAIGAGWDMPFGLNVSARYVIGLSDVNDGNGEEAKNRTFQLSVGFKLFGI